MTGHMVRISTIGIGLATMTTVARAQSTYPKRDVADPGVIAKHLPACRAYSRGKSLACGLAPRPTRCGSPSPAMSTDSIGAGTLFARVRVSTDGRAYTH